LRKLYSADVAIIATAYFVAESEEQAQKMANSLISQPIQFSDRRQDVGVDGEIIITGETYGVDMPEISLSPAMTINQPQSRVYFQEDLEEEDNGVHGLTGVEVN
jgi:hypothetical protein